MIVFKKIRWKNFLSTGNAFTEIDFLRNQSTLIIGENGSGKSTLLDALCFSLYGKPFRKINKPLLVNTINKKDTVVELEFQISKHHYKVVRGIKPNVFEIYQNGNLLNQNADAREYQEYLERSVLKLNFKSFSQIVILGSASFTPFMQLPSGHRREVIEDLLDINIFSTMNSLLKDLLTVNKTELTEADYQITHNTSLIQVEEDYIKKAKASNDEIIKQKVSKGVEYSNAIDELNTRLEDAQNEIKDKQHSISDIDTINKKRSDIASVESKLQLKLQQLRKEVDFFEGNDDCPTCKQGIAHDHKSSIIGDVQDKAQEVTGAISALEKQHTSVVKRLEEISAVQGDIQNLNAQVTEYNTKVTTYLQMIKDLKKEVQSLQDSNDTYSEENLNKYKDKLEEYANLKNELSEQKKLLDVAATLLRDTGIKTKIIKQYIPIMNKLINKYLAQMDFFVQFELNEQFEEQIKSRYRDVFKYDSFSEGEKMRIDLSLLFTWRAVAKLRNSVSTNLLIMDEVFDSSLDYNGTDEFLKIIHQLTSDTNVFIISHKGDQLFDKFHSVVRFEKHKNFSRVA